MGPGSSSPGLGWGRDSRGLHRRRRRNWLRLSVMLDSVAASKLKSHPQVLTSLPDHSDPTFLLMPKQPLRITDAAYLLPSRGEKLACK